MTGVRVETISTGVVVSSVSVVGVVVGEEEKDSAVGGAAVGPVQAERTIN